MGANPGGFQAILLVFWATWCRPCRNEVPELIKLHDEIKDNKNIEIIAADIDESDYTVALFAKENDIKYTVMIDEKGAVAKSYKVTGIPTNILIDKKGEIKYNGYIFKDAEKELKKLLKDEQK